MNKSKRHITTLGGAFVLVWAFLSSVGCINPTKTLKGPKEGMDYAESRARVIAVIDDLKAFFGGNFPTSNGKKIPDAVSTIVDKT